MERAKWKIIACVTILCLAGVISLWNVTPSAEFGAELSSKQFMTKQLMFLVGGLVAMLGLLLFNYIHLRGIAYIIYAVCVVALLAVTFGGGKVKGASRWFFIGPFSIQPSEFAKIAVVLALARFMMYQRNISTIRGLIGPFVLVIIPMILSMLQPDLGTAIIFFPILLVMIFIAGARITHILAILGLCVLSLPIMYKFVLKDYQKERINSFLSSSQDKTGKNYHREQSIKAIAAGGFFGGRMLTDPSFVPERHTDFIFTVIGEGGGFIGVIIVLGCFAYLFYQAFNVAYNTREPFGKLIIVGMTTWLTFQTLTNVAMTIGLAPVVGITLPFLSYGGSSILTSFIAIGIILNVAVNWVPTFAGRDFGYERDRISDITEIR